MRRPLILVALLVPAVAVAAITLVPEDAPSRTPARLSIGGLAAGGLDREQLDRLLDNAVDTTPSKVVMSLGSRRTEIAADELGVSIDVSATVDAALRGGAGSTLVPVLRTDDAKLTEVVSTLVDRADQPVVEADLRAADGRVAPVLPVAGQHAEPAPVRTALLGALVKLPWPAAVQLPVVLDPATTTAADVRDLADRANRVLDAGVRLVAGEQRARVSTSELAAAFTISSPLTAGGAPSLALRPRQRDAIVADLVDELAVDAEEPELSAPRPTTMLSEKGDATWKPVDAEVTLEAQGENGQGVSADDVRAALESVLAPGASTGPLPVTPRVVQPTTSDRDAQRINSVLGTFTTFFACCQSRVTNITTMARELDGLLVGQGQQFSLNTTIGPRTRAKGYVEAPFILDGELSTDVGGGVSQVATTMLNAVFFAGLDIDSHRAHSFYISRYPAGREATVNYPSIDLRWTNDSRGPVLVRTRTTSTSVTVTLYGVKQDQTVSSTAGPRRKVPGKDFRITVTRTITVPGREDQVRRFTTTYNKPPPH